MKNLPHPTTDAKALYSDICIAKRAPASERLLDLKPIIENAYDLYKENAPEIGRLRKLIFTSSDKAALLESYTQATQPLRNFKNDLFEECEGQCPFCGIGEPSTIEHYAPKEHYPQFSVFTLNLFPCCPTCNSKKGMRLIDKSSDLRLFFHPYFDDVRNYKLLKATIEIKEKSIIARFSIKTRMELNGLPGEVFEILSSHFHQLGLAKRYRLLALSELRGRYAPLKRLWDKSRSQVQISRKLKEISEDYAQGFGAQNWRVALYDALAIHDEFCNGGFSVINR